MKYSAQVEPLKNQLVSVNSALIVLPAVTNVDKLASGLALKLSLEQAGKKVQIVSEDTLRVSHTNLFGIGEVKNQIVGGGTASSANTFVLTLEDVVDETGNVNSEKLDYFQEGKNLQLIFTIPQGKQFLPSKITTAYQGGQQAAGYEFVFVIGADNLNELGSIYTQNQTLFTPGQIVNIDNSQTNAQYGATNIVDPNASSVSEMMVSVISDLGLNMQEDIATNLLTGMYDATQNMSTNVKPDTFVAASTAMQAGGKLPVENMANQGFVNQPQQYMQPQQFGMQSQPVPVEQAQQQPAQSIPVVMETNPQQAAQSVPVQMQAPVIEATPVETHPQGNNSAVAVPQDHAGFDLRQVFNLPFDPVTGQAGTPTQNQPLPSAEERPQGEAVNSGNPEISNPAPDWLVPKIYKSGN